MEGIIRKTIYTFEMIKFSHSIFALPFALAAMLVAARDLPDFKIFFLIVAAMVTARSAAMSFNRLVDKKIDAKNPRTATRHLPKGVVSKKFVSLFILITSALFIFICSKINPLSFFLSPFVLLFLFGYSYSKCFTWSSHLWLGLGLGLAPLGAWIAVTGEWPWPAIPLSLAVTFWVAGFDIIYATQDFDFDKKTGLHSLVARFGIPKALFISRFFHFSSILLLFFFGHTHQFGWIYNTTILLIAAGLIYEQSLVKPHDLSRVNAAFFNMNGIISILFLLGVFLQTILT